MRSRKQQRKDDCTEGQVDLQIQSRLTALKIDSKDFEVSVGGGDGFFGVVMGDEARVVIEGEVPLSTELVEDGQQRGVLFVETLANEVDNRDVMPRLASNAESVAKHEGQRSLEHGFVGLLQASFFVKFENFACGRELAVGACQEAADLRPVDALRF